MAAAAAANLLTRTEGNPMMPSREPPTDHSRGAAPAPSRWLVDCCVALMAVVMIAPYGVGILAAERAAAGAANTDAYHTAFDVVARVSQVIALMVLGGFGARCLLRWHKGRRDGISAMMLRPAAQRILRICAATVFCLLFVAVAATRSIATAPSSVLVVWAGLFFAALLIGLVLVDKADTAAAQP